VSDPLLAELREHFRESAAARLQEIGPLLDVVTHDGNALQQLMRHFHAFSGLGATYGYPRISELGDELEGSILPLAKRGEPPSADVIARWRVVVEEIARELC
jgi:chemotaxis protein histidine kinase CheA